VRCVQLSGLLHALIYEAVHLLWQAYAIRICSKGMQKIYTVTRYFCAY